MVFTNEDFQKIHNWLKLNSAKDSEFPLTQDISKQDKLSILQGGKNKVTTIEVFSAMFAAYLDSYAREDYFNITKYIYGKTGSVADSKMNLETAVSLCPEEIKRGGQVLTFINYAGDWETWRYLGVSNEEWNNTNAYWQCVDGKDNLGIIVTLSSNTISFGASADVSIHVETIDSGKANLISIYANGTLVEDFNLVSVANKTITVDTDTTIKVVASQYGFTHTHEQKIEVVYPCYVGAQGATFNIMQAASGLINVAGGNLKGIYKVTTTDTNNRLYILAPNAVVLDNITLNGVDIPMSVTTMSYQDITYKLYQSESAFEKGTYSIIIGTYDGINRDIINSLSRRVTELERKVEELQNG